MRNREDAASIFKKPNEKPTEMPLFDKLAKKNLDLRYWIRYSVFLGKIKDNEI